MWSISFRLFCKRLNKCQIAICVLCTKMLPEDQNYLIFFRQITQISMWIVFPIWFRNPGLRFKDFRVKLLTKPSGTSQSTRESDRSRQFPQKKIIAQRSCSAASPDRLSSLAHSFFGAERRWRALYQHKGPYRHSARQNNRYWAL